MSVMPGTLHMQHAHAASGLILADCRPLSHNGASLLVTAHMDQFRNDTLTLQVRSPAADNTYPLN